ncbi:MAG: hypothetical protein GY772_07065 [bacterium]|nr:hypothetical protein [bacterium]
MVESWEVFCHAEELREAEQTEAFFKGLEEKFQEEEDNWPKVQARLKAQRDIVASMDREATQLFEAFDKKFRKDQKKQLHGCESHYKKIYQSKKAKPSDDESEE